MKRSERSGQLVLAGAPIGNYGDASPRLVELLASADVVAAEDTRRFARLCQGLGVDVQGQVISYHEHNEAARTERLVEAATSGQTVLLITDAGMPSVSDPGYRLVRACIDVGVLVTVVPGPSAVLAALAVSGLPSDRFTFEGFAPRKPGERDRALEGLQDEPRTMIFFESPHRTPATLAAMERAFGAEREAAVCRELTKTFEEVVRGPLGELVLWAGEREVKGEVCLVVAGAPARPVTEADLQALAQDVVARAAATGMRLKDVVSGAAETHGVQKRHLYELVLKIK